MDISVVILNWNVKELLRRCLQSVSREAHNVTYEVIVVDNASADGSVEMVRTEFPQVRVIANDENSGFAKGNNIGIRKATGNVVLLLNPDTELVENVLGQVVDFLRARPEAGLVGAQFLNEDGSVQPSVRRFPTLLDQCLVLLKLHNSFPRLGVLRRYFAYDLDMTKTQKVDQVSGTFLAIPRATLDTVGLLDERFFIWYEDVDYCRRVWQSGRHVWYTPDIRIRNRGGASFAQVVAFRKQRMLNQSMAAYFRKWHSTGAWLVIELVRPFSLLLSVMVDILVYGHKAKEGRGSRRLKAK